MDHKYPIILLKISKISPALFERNHIQLATHVSVQVSCRHPENTERHWCVTLNRSNGAAAERVLRQNFKHLPTHEIARIVQYIS